MKLEKEIWKDVPGYVGLYKVSDMGKIKSVERFVSHKRDGKKFFPERILKPYIEVNGISRVQLSNKGIIKTIGVHQLVMLAFIGTPEDKQEVMHLEHVKINNDNSLRNLRYGSRACNCAFMIDDGTVLIGEKSPCAKLSNLKASSIREIHKTQKISYGKLAKMFDVSKSSIGRVLRNENWLKDMEV